MARRAPRNYAREYAARKARGAARGLTLSQARGHPRAGERSASSMSGVPLRGAARRGAEARASRELGLLGRIVETVREALAPPVQWRAPTPGGTRDMVTRDPAVVMAALAEAAASGRDVLVTVIGKGTGKGRAARQRSTGRQDARRLHDRLAAYGEDIGDAIAAMDDDDSDSYGVGGFTSYGVYEVKMFSG